MAVGLDWMVVGYSASAHLGNPSGRNAALFQLCGDKSGSRYAQRIVDAGCARRTVGGSRNPHGQSIFIRYASQLVEIERLRGICQACRIEVEKEVDGSDDTFAAGVDEGRGICNMGVLTLKSPVFITGLNSRCVKRRFPVPMSVSQPCTQRVQTTVIIYRIACTPVVVLLQKMSVGIEQALDFQNLLQFGKCPPVLIVPGCIASVLFRQGVGIINEPLIPANVGRCIYRPFPADLSDMKRESGGQRQQVICKTVRAAIAVEVLKGSRAGEFQNGTYPFGDTVLPLHAV